MLPPVSLPRAKSQSPAATAAAEPEELPPGIKSILVGFLVGPKAVVSQIGRASCRERV